MKQDSSHQSGTADLPKPATPLTTPKREILIKEIIRDEDEIKQLLTRKDELVRNLQDLDAKIYRLESSYLDETRSTGNVVRGFDQYLMDLPASSLAAGSHASNSNSGNLTLKRQLLSPINNAERIFTNTSWNGCEDIDDNKPNSYKRFSSGTTKDKVKLPKTSHSTNTVKHSRKSSSSTNNGGGHKSPVVIRLPKPSDSSYQDQEHQKEEQPAIPKIRITFRPSVSQKEDEELDV